MTRRRASAEKLEGRTRGARLGFRVDRATKAIVERAAYLERRSVTDFCLSALGAAAEQSIARHESLILSERERSAYFEALVHPPKPSARLRRAAKAERERIGS